MNRAYKDDIYNEGNKDGYNGDMSLGIVHMKGSGEFEASKARGIISSHGQKDSRYHSELCRVLLQYLEYSCNA